MSDTKNTEIPNLEKEDNDKVISPEAEVVDISEEDNGEGVEPEKDIDAEDGGVKETEDDDETDKNNTPEDNSSDDTENEPEARKEEDNEGEKETEDIQNDESEDNNETDTNSTPDDDSSDDSENSPEAEKEEDNEGEEETEDIQNDESEDNDETDTNSTSDDDSSDDMENEAEVEKEEDNNKGETDSTESKKEDDKSDSTSKESKNGFTNRKKLIKILKWTGIVSIPLLAVAVLFYLKPNILTNIFNKPEQLVYTPKTAAIQWTAEELEMINIVGQTLAETEKIWNNIFTEKGGIYKKPDFTIYTERISSVCVDSEAEVPETEKIIEKSSIGTFYCPEGKRIYIDLSLHRDLKNRLDIPGDFAQGYIVAHEIGHHVQNLAGISEQIPAARLTLGEKEFDMVLQRIELQADCFAGIWARHTADQLYNTSREEFADALNAVTHYSREHLKQKKINDTMPDPFTHSSSRLRLRWFTIGYDKGTFDACDTFTIMEL